jgi:integrase/recombinase XerD
MLSDLFIRSLPRYEASPHAADLEGFAHWLDVEGYARPAMRWCVRRLYRALSSCTCEAGSAFSDEQLRALFDAWPRKGYVGTERLFRRYLRSEGRFVAAMPCEPRLALKQQYLHRLVELRGLAPATVTYIDWALTDFLTHVLAPSEQPASITPQAIDAFFNRRRPELARRTFHHTVGAVRRFLRHAFECGELPHALHRFELPKAFRFEQPPRALNWDHVEQLLAGLDRATPVGCRDHAILHLLSHSGLRPGEVAALTLKSIDWQAGTLRVQQSKTHSTLVLPLSPTTMQILHTYIEQFRPPSRYPQLFFCVHRPHDPLNNVAISVRFKVHARRSGLPIADASAYALRHTFAMRLLSHGVGIKAIGDLLGHHCLASTSAYLRIQTDMLREVALDVPTDGGAQ